MVFTEGAVGMFKGDSGFDLVSCSVFGTLDSFDFDRFVADLTFASPWYLGLGCGLVHFARKLESFLRWFSM